MPSLTGKRLLGAALACVFALWLPTSAFAAVSVNDAIAQPQNLPATMAVGPIPGNDVGGGSNFLSRLNSGSIFPSPYDSGWSLVGKSDDAGFGPFTSNPETPTGTLTFDSPIDGPFVITLKAGNAFTAYLFDETFTGVTSIDFTTQALGFKDLSHASLFKQSGTTTGTTTGTTNGTTNGTNTPTNGTGPTTGGGGGVIPEPATLILWSLLGMGAAGCTYVARRRKTSA